MCKLHHVDDAASVEGRAASARRRRLVVNSVMLLVIAANYLFLGSAPNVSLEMEAAGGSLAVIASKEDGAVQPPPRFVAIMLERFGSSKRVTTTEPVWPIRDSARDLFHNWTFVAEEIREGGHEWCAIARDNWSCVGERYKEVLKSTPLFDRSLNMNEGFPPDSNVYIEGNSFVGELAYTFVCNTPGAQIWFLDGIGGDSIVAYAPESNVTVFLLVNPSTLALQMLPKRSMALLKQVQFVPDYVVRGSVNGVLVDRFRELTLEHRQLYIKEYPRAFYLEYFDPHIPPGCQADFQNCHESGTDHSHTCFPGPINGAAEEFVRAIVGGDASVALCDPPDCTCHMDDKSGLLLSCHRHSGGLG